MTSAGRQSRTFSPLFTLQEGARLELTQAELTFRQVEHFTGLEEEDEPELSLLIPVLALTQLCLPRWSSLPPQRQSHTRQIHRKDGCSGDAFPLLHNLSWGLLWL